MRSTRSQAPDYILLLLFGLLIIFGLWMLSSAGVSIGLQRFDDPYFFVKRQLTYGFFPGLVLFFVVAKIPYDVWRKYSLHIFGLGIAALVMVFLPGFGANYGTGANSWLSLGGISFQPSEVMKLLIVIYMAAYLAKMGDLLEDFQQGFLVALGMGVLPVALVALQPDVGTAAILFAIVIIMLFVARAKMTHILLLALLAIVVFWLMILAAPYRAERLTTFLHPELDPEGKGYQINQAFLAIGSGGILGKGLGHSRQKFEYLPEVHADSIFAIIAEEMGFIIVVLFLALILGIALRGFKIARGAPDDFSKLLVSGIIGWFMVQSLLNIGAMVGLMPLTGVPLPFVSHGGSALVIAMVGVGMVANVSRYSRIT